MKAIRAFAQLGYYCVASIMTVILGNVVFFNVFPPNIPGLMTLGAMVAIVTVLSFILMKTPGFRGLSRAYDGWVERSISDQAAKHIIIGAVLIALTTRITYAIQPALGMSPNNAAALTLLVLPVCLATVVVVYERQLQVNQTQAMTAS